MSLNYRQEREQKNRRNKVLGAVFLVCAIALLGLHPILSGIGRVAHLVGLPVWQVTAAARDDVHYAEDFARPRSSLISELQNLRQRVSDDDAKVKAYDAVVDQNAHIMSLLGSSVSSSTVLARVLSRPSFSMYDTLVVDAGTKNGVAVGALVYARGPYVVGHVTRAYDLTSVVTLFSSPGEAHPVMVETLPSLTDKKFGTSTDDGVPVDEELTLYGQGGGTFRAEVPKQMRFAPGTSASLEIASPAIVANLTTEFVPPDGSLKEVYASYPFGLNQLEWVQVQTGTTTVAIP